MIILFKSIYQCYPKFPALTSQTKNMNVYDLFVRVSFIFCDVTSVMWQASDFFSFHTGKQCTMPPARHTVGETFLKTAKTIHHYKDQLQYFCDFGYALPSSDYNNATCNSQGVFEGDLMDQNCTSNQLTSSTLCIVHSKFIQFISLKYMTFKHWVYYKYFLPFIDE